MNVIDDTLDPSQAARRIVAHLESGANPDNVAGMARYGINPRTALGISIPTLRGLAKELRPLSRTRPSYVHDLAHELWQTDVHEARLLASFIDVPKLVTAQQADEWVAQLDSWDLCDQLMGLFVAVPFAYEKVVLWAKNDAEFVRRSGFVLLARLAVHDKASPDERFIELLELTLRYCTDERTYVKKGVNWAVRQVGKRSYQCNAAAIRTAERILAENPGSSSARWIARDALRELRSAAVLERLGPD